jgi:hypothetical protein
MSHHTGWVVVVVVVVVVVKGMGQFHKMTHGEGDGGSKISPKSVTTYLNGPLLTLLYFGNATESSKRTWQQ